MLKDLYIVRFAMAISLFVCFEQTWPGSSVAHSMAHKFAAQEMANHHREWVEKWHSVHRWLTEVLFYCLCGTSNLKAWKHKKRDPLNKHTGELFFWLGFMEDYENQESRIIKVTHFNGSSKEFTQLLRTVSRSQILRSGSVMDYNELRCMTLRKLAAVDDE